MTAVLAVFPTPMVVAMLLPLVTPIASTSTTTSSGRAWILLPKTPEATGTTTSSRTVVILDVDSAVIYI